MNKNNSKKKEVFLNLSFLSKKDIEKSFKKIKKGNRYIPSKGFSSFDYCLGKERIENKLKLFLNNKEENVKKINKKIKEGKYKFTPYTGIAFPKKGSKKPRTILSPDPSDRIIFNAILEKIKPDLKYIYTNYNIFGAGSRINLISIREILLNIKDNSKKYPCVLKIDIKSFFPSINQTKLLKRLSSEDIDENILSVIKKSFENKINIIKNSLEYRKYFPDPNTGIGIPQGCSYSPLLANYYALYFDKWIKDQKDLISYRYLDDLLILTTSRKKAERVFKHISKISDQLDLKIHPLKEGSNKSYIGRINKIKPIEYLGIHIYQDRIKIPEKVIQKAIMHTKNNIFNKSTLKKFDVKKILRVMGWYTYGWRRHYIGVCRKDYEEVRQRINVELRKYYNQTKFKEYIKKDMLEDKRLYF